MKVRDANLERSRTDLHLTSTGKGHFYEREKPFPPANFQRSFNNILPRPLARSHTVAVDEMETTNGHFHNKKTHQPPLTNVAYKRAPGSYNVHYMKHNLEYLRKAHSRTFTMGDRISETAHRYCPLPQGRATTTPPGIRPLQLHSPGGAAKGTHGDPHTHLLTQIQPYLSTTNKEHRPFTESEKTRLYPAKNALTFWEMEGYPKVWGHGSVDGKNIPPRKIFDRKSIMTDSTLGGNEIKSQVHQIPARPGLKPVPNKGLQSLVQSSYIRHAEAPSLNLSQVPNPMPAELHFNHGRRRQHDSANCPSMYSTEYQHYGGAIPVRV